MSTASIYWSGRIKPSFGPIHVKSNGAMKQSKHGIQQTKHKTAFPEIRTIQRWLITFLNNAAPTAAQHK